MIHSEAVTSCSLADGGENAMQRDMDLVRSILMKIDEGNGRMRMSDLLAEDATDQDRQKLVYHLKMLTEQTGFVSGIAAHTMSGNNWIELDVTWAGHEFLDNIRDPDVWKQTKAGASKVGGFSLKILSSVAEGLLKARVDKLLGSGLD